MKTKKRFGDRRDGTRVRNQDGMHELMVYLQPLRCDADVYINYKMDVTNMVKYIEKKKKENPKEKITYFHAFVTAIAKTVYNRPLLNRFVVNKRFYDRNNVTISFVAKGEFKDEASEFMTTVDAKENDTFEIIRTDLVKRVNHMRTSKGGSTDDAVAIVGKLPRLIRNIVMAGFKWMDRHDLLPSSLCSDNIYYSSIIVSNLGSLKCGAIYHHLTDFGTNSILITIGDIHKEEIINEDGKKEIRDFCEWGITLDERIADGFYFVKSVKLAEYILSHPELLEEEVSKKVVVESEKQN